MITKRKNSARSPKRTQCDRAIVEGINRGLADMRSGRTIPHKKAMQRLRAIVARAALNKAGQTKAGARNP
jgi:hypothetical protein